MYYINKEPNASGNHGNPMGQAFPGCACLPDGLLTAYLDCKGFANIILDGDVVESVETNQEALDAYDEANPEVEPEKVPTAEEEIKELKSKLDASIQANANLEECLIEMAEIVYA